MTDICDLPGCTNIASQRCSRCKISYYCSKDHQRAGWKHHKRMCNELESTKKEEEIQPAKQTDGNVALLLGSLSKTDEVPHYHKEYRKRYPADMGGFKTLETSCMNQKSVLVTDNIPGSCIIHNYGTKMQLLTKRWMTDSPAYLDVIFRPKFGQVWTGHPCLRSSRDYGTDYSTRYRQYQVMRNISSPKIILEGGKSYVSVGFVDLQQFMEADISDSNVDKPVQFYGYERSEIAVARVKIILDLIDHDIPTKDILQIWYSSSISKEASKALKSTCKRLEAIESDARLKNLFDGWSRATLSVKEATARWAQYVRYGILTSADIPRLRYEEDRVFYARYLLTGEFLLKSNRSNQGNTTRFCLPLPEYASYKKEEENLFHSFNIAEMQYNGSLKSSVEKRFLDLLGRMIENIKKNRLVISVKVQHLGGEMQHVFREIRDKDPVLIDWSNIPDCLTIQEFFHVAKQCSGPKTVHKFHLMNWSSKVFGTNLIDYVDLNENYVRNKDESHFKDRNGKLNRVMDRLKIEFADMMKCGKFQLPDFMLLDVYPLDEMELSSAVLNHRYADSFMEFMFNQQDVEQKKWIKRPCGLMKRGQSTIDVSFSFCS